MAPFRLFSVAAAPAVDTTPAHALLSNGTPARALLSNSTHAHAMLSNGRHQPADLSHHINRTTLARAPSILKGLYSYIVLPGMLNLAGGLPFAGYFPFDSLEAAVCSPGRFPAKLVKQLNTPVPIMSAAPPPPPPPPSPGPRSTSTSSPRSRLLSFFKSPTPAGPPAERFLSTHFEIPKFSLVGNRGSRMDVASALQYGLASGFPPLVEFVKDFALNHMHGGRIPYSNPGILLTCGNTDGLGKVVEMLAERGDNMLVEEYTYPNAIETAAPYGVGMVPVKVDQEGLIPESLRDVLEGWDVQGRGRRPKFLYTVTVGQNPTGGLLSLKRKEAIYALCDRFDVLIIEDDPYWYLQYTTGVTTTLNSPTCGSRYPFLASLIPSFLTLDTAGRVLRLDTFSKSIAPGCRLGFITAQQPFIERLSQIVETTTQAPSGFSQVMVLHLLQGVWGMDGWVSWLEGLRSAYEARMRAMCAVLQANTHTTTSHDLGGSDEGQTAIIVDKREMYSFHTPDAGMFVWVHIHITSHPAYSSYLSRDPRHTKREMVARLWGYTAERHSCLSCPGSVFAADQIIMEDSAAERVRLCFAAIEENLLVDASERFCKGVREFWELTAEEIEHCCKPPPEDLAGASGGVGRE